LCAFEWGPSFMFSFMASSNPFLPSTAWRMWAFSRPLRIFLSRCSCQSCSA
jgi:hypothetical protein